MFGHDDKDDNGQDNSAAPVDEPIADGSLGANDDHPDVTKSDFLKDDPPASAPKNNDNAGKSWPPEPDNDEEELLPAQASGDGKNDDNELLEIKKDALQKLSPLVGQLDQTPEEEFQTTMMMIQAADDQTLIKKAYGAAQKIADEKTKAQALLDVINEINYFTQPKD